MKKQPAVHNKGFVELVRNKHQQFNTKIYSCGNGDDNNIGIWNFKDDDFFDDKNVITLKDRCTAAFACYGNDLFVGAKHKNHQNVTQHILYKYNLEGENQVSMRDFQIATFNEKITAVDVSSNGIYVIAGSSDHTFKCLRIVEENSSYTHRKTYELEGAIVFISIDPTSTNYAVSSSDGKITIFSIEDIDGDYDELLDTAIFKVCNAFKPEDGSARLRVCWSPEGDELFIPAEGFIKVISTARWDEKLIIPYDNSPLDLFCSVVYCRNSLFAVNNKDKLVCFDLTTLKPTYETDLQIEVLQKDEKGQLVSSIAFINDGYLAIASRTGDIYKHKYETLPADAVMLDDDEGDVGKLKSQYNFSYNLDEVYSSKPQKPVVVNTKPAILIEKARTHEILTPGSAKESNDLACLKWNAYGRIINRVIDGERSVEITFHDASVHAEIMIDNQSAKYIFGDLNNSLVALASQRNNSDESVLYVNQIGSWDRENQVWAITMPNEEVIETVAVGQNFVVVYTDMRFIRIYSSSGLLRFIFSSTGIRLVYEHVFKFNLGPLRSLIAGSCFLGLVRDTGSLIIEKENDEFYERRYAIDLYKVTPLSPNVLTNTQKSLSLALSPESDLSWISFTQSGNLCSMDDHLVVRYLTPDNLWIPVFMGADILKDGETDSIWPISLTDRNQPKFRYIYCRRRTKPDFEKIEVPETEEWNIPIGEKENEKDKFEHDLMLNEILQSVLRSSQTGFSANEIQSLRGDNWKQIFMLFSLCCRKGRDARSLELANLADLQTLPQFRTFAFKNNRTTLVNRIESLYNERAANMASPGNTPSSSHQQQQRSEPVPQQDRKLTVQRKVQKTNVSSTLIANPSSSTNQELNNSLISGLTPSRNERTLTNVVNTQDSLISIPTASQMSERKRPIEASISNSAKSSKKQRTSDDFFDSLC